MSPLIYLLILSSDLCLLDEPEDFELRMLCHDRCDLFTHFIDVIYVYYDEPEDCVCLSAR